MKLYKKQAPSVGSTLPKIGLQIYLIKIKNLSDLCLISNFSAPQRACIAINAKIICFSSVFVWQSLKRILPLNVG